MIQIASGVLNLMEDKELAKILVSLAALTLELVLAKSMLIVQLVSMILPANGVERVRVVHQLIKLVEVHSTSLLVALANSIETVPLAEIHQVANGV
jgi:hypothetical protein